MVTFLTIRALSPRRAEGTRRSNTSRDCCSQRVRGTPSTNSVRGTRKTWSSYAISDIARARKTRLGSSGDGAAVSARAASTSSPFFFFFFGRSSTASMAGSAPARFRGAARDPGLTSAGGLPTSCASAAGAPASAAARSMDASPEDRRIGRGVFWVISFGLRSLGSNGPPDAPCPQSRKRSYREVVKGIRPCYTDRGTTGNSGPAPESPRSRRPCYTRSAPPDLGGMVCPPKGGWRASPPGSRRARPAGAGAYSAVAVRSFAAPAKSARAFM
jgi:hypothetical protein